jgi:uncharacterized protein
VEETAYGRDEGEPETPAESLKTDAQRTGVRLVDPSIVGENFEQEQQIRGYYSFPEVFDVDRYPVDGTDRDLVMAVRELNQDGLSDSSKNWANLHTVYTHGYGLVAAYGNQRTESGTDVLKQPAEAEQNLPPEGVLTDLAGEDGYRGQIYYGEKNPEYSIVGKRDDGNDIEVDLPNTGGEGEQTSTYAGKGGVPVGGFFNKLLYAVKFSEPNIVLSDRVHENSKILYDREPKEMVKKVAPWLQVDGDAYPAMIDGKIQWIVDAYTTTDRYPSSDLESLDTMLDDTLGQNSQLQALPTDEINYMRNSVKATVDAYDGTVTLYQWDEEDPLLQTWMKVFPGSVQPKSDIPESLLEHLRYPEDMFKVQRYQLASYHVTNASDFYKGTDRWEVPEDPNQADKLQPPYRLSVLTPDGGPDPNFSLTSVYTPYKKSNLASFVAVNADPTSDQYGEFEVLSIRGSAQIDGPGNIAGKFANDDDVKSELRDFTVSAGNTVKYGNLLTLPVGQGLLYVQPIYVTRDIGSGAVPELQLVAVAFDNRIGSGATLDEAINDALGLKGTGEPDPGDGEPGDGEPGSGGGDQTVDELVQAAADHYEAAQAALAEGDWKTYGEEMEKLQEALDKALALQEGGASPSPDEPTDSPSDEPTNE